MPMIKGGGTFTTTLGNFTKIELNADWITDFSGTGWVKNGWQSQTWTGDAASVSYSGTIGGGGMTCDGGSMTITFTIEKPTVAVTGVTLSQTEATLNIGETLTLTATVAPDNATDQTVTWTSSDETVATVADGVVTAVAVGTATITVTTTDGAKTATCAVTVAATAPEVAWDKAEKSGSFTMPGGNVTLEPEYYPQAALTAAPTAINDVPATTDGAIVNAGTVASIGETTTAQGTVMYYVSPSALGDAALLALAADQWTADVPTAKSLAAGQAYVYYYVRGNDSDTDEQNFSDGDILAANALTVTIAAAPTYAVTFAEGTEESDKWTASPATDVKKGETVTVTYSGTKKVIGVKAEKKSAAAAARPLAEAVAADLGKIAGADGNIYDTKAAAEAANTTAVAMIAYVGSSTEHGTYTHGLALALSDEGSMNWSTAKSSCEGKTAVTGAAWLLPSQSQWKTMFSANGGNEDDYTGLQTAANNAGGDGTLQNGSLFWTSTESGDNAYSVALPSGNSSVNFYSDPKTTPWKARACLAF